MVGRAQGSPMRYLAWVNIDRSEKNAEAACRIGLEGLVSKHRDRPYRAGRSPHWVKVKNRKLAFSRVQDQSG